MPQVPQAESEAGRFIGESVVDRYLEVPPFVRWSSAAQRAAHDGQSCASPAASANCIIELMLYLPHVMVQRLGVKALMA